MTGVIQYFYMFLITLVIAACGGGGDGDDGNAGGLSVPADAVEFNATNAKDFALAGLAQIDFASATTELAFKSDSETRAKGAIKFAISQIFRQRSAYRSTADRSGTENCIPGDASSGSITYDTTETSNSASGSVVFDNCKPGDGIIIDGSLSFSSSFDDAGNYAATGEANVTFNIDTEQFTIAMDFDISGNDFSGEFTETFNFSLTGITDGGFLLNTTVPITGNELDLTVTGGQIVLSGANATRIRVTVVNTNLVDIELDDGSGTFVLLFEDEPLI